MALAYARHYQDPRPCADQLALALLGPPLRELRPDRHPRPKPKPARSQARSRSATNRTRAGTRTSTAARSSTSIRSTRARSRQPDGATLAAALVAGISAATAAYNRDAIRRLGLDRFKAAHPTRATR
jgi:hypothetical protein